MRRCKSEAWPLAFAKVNCLDQIQREELNGKAIRDSDFAAES